MSTQKTNKRIAECVGLWLAEGDNKSRHEITFTNNCWELIELFHRTMIKLFEDKKFRIRVYVYTKDGEEVKVQLKSVQVNYYTDKRATKPYYIWRLASVKLMKKWRSIVKKEKTKQSSYIGILRGFFAGEGNIKESSKNSRAVRISQAKRLTCIDKALSFLEIKYVFSADHRNGYIITGRTNLEKLAKWDITVLHPQKKKKFYAMMKKYKQTHYKKGHLKWMLQKTLRKKHYTTEQLTKIFKRSKARICEVLIDLKKEQIINNFRVRSKDYWVTNKEDKVIISRVKSKYLNILKDDGKRTADIAKNIGVCYKAASKRLEELRELDLVKREEDKTWNKMKTTKQVIVIWH